MLMNLVVSLAWFPTIRLEWSSTAATAELSNGRSPFCATSEATKDAYRDRFSGVLSIVLSNSAVTLK